LLLLRNRAGDGGHRVLGRRSSNADSTRSGWAPSSGMANARPDLPSGVGGDLLSRQCVVEPGHEKHYSIRVQFVLHGRVHLRCMTCGKSWEEINDRWKR
jgi:hypothetical protein